LTPYNTSIIFHVAGPNVFFSTLLLHNT